MHDLTHVRIRLFHREERMLIWLERFLGDYGRLARGMALTSLPEAGEISYAEVMVDADTAWTMSIQTAFLEGEVVEVSRLPLEGVVPEHESTGIAFITRMGQLLESGKTFSLSYNTLSPKPGALRKRSKEELHALLDTQVVDLPLDLRVRNALRDTHQPPLNHQRDPLVYLGQVVQLDAQGLRRRPGIGTATVARVADYVVERGLSLGMDAEDMQGWQPPDERAKAGG